MAKWEAGGGSLVLGLDLSTQSLKAVVLRADDLTSIGEWSVNYDSDLPAYGTRGGVHHFRVQHHHGRPMETGEVTAPTMMWVDALQLLFERMKSSNCPFGQIGAVSASGQQHGSVYWRRGACDAHLAHLRKQEPGIGGQDLVTLMKRGEGAFSVPVRKPCLAIISECMPCVTIAPIDYSPTI